MAHMFLSRNLASGFTTTACMLRNRDTRRSIWARYTQTPLRELAEETKMCGLSGDGCQPKSNFGQSGVWMLSNPALHGQRCHSSGNSRHRDSGLGLCPLRCGLYSSYITHSDLSKEPVLGRSVPTHAANPHKMNPSLCALCG